MDADPVFGKGILPFPETFKGEKGGKVVLGFKASLMFDRQGIVFISPIMPFDKILGFGFKIFPLCQEKINLQT